MTDKKRAKALHSQTMYIAILGWTAGIVLIVSMIDFADSHLAGVFTHAELYWQDRCIEWRAKLKKKHSQALTSLW